MILTDRDRRALAALILTPAERRALTSLYEARGECNAR